MAPLFMINTEKNMTTTTHTPLALIILDGWGYSKNTEHNAIAQANTPTWDQLIANFPNTLISGSGNDVGLPCGQMGNSEVGHIHLGAGRLIEQDLTRIDHAIADGSFLTNPVLNAAIDKAIANNKAVHAISLLSPGGVHSHENHLFALTKLAAQKQLSKFYIHAILDGRDTPPSSAQTSIDALENLLTAQKCGKIISIIGRYYAMDRDKRWDRTEKAYHLLTTGKAEYQYASAHEALLAAYARGETDEFVNPTHIIANNNEIITLNEGDVLIFMNYRTDRTRQLCHALVDKNFTGFIRNACPQLAELVTLTEYAKDIPSKIVFPPLSLANSFGEYLANLGHKQLRIAETEKYAHVTFFFNGGREEAFAGEDRVLIPSPKVATYDLKPEMSAVELTDQLITAIKSKKYTAIICNYANADMVGHSGNFAAAVKAIETLDNCLKRVITALQEAGGEAVITADHGNAECMFDNNTNQPHTAHTNFLVPFVYIGRPATIIHNKGVLSDIAPTLLKILGLEQPQEMTGSSLVQLSVPEKQ